MGDNCSLVERLDLLPGAVLLMSGGKLPARRANSAHARRAFTTCFITGLYTTLGTVSSFDHAEPQIGSRRGLEHPRSFQFQLLIGERLEKAQAVPKEDRDDAHMDFVNQPGS
jgi:hypothetical protein